MNKIVGFAAGFNGSLCPYLILMKELLKVKEDVCDRGLIAPSHTSSHAVRQPSYALISFSSQPLRKAGLTKALAFSLLVKRMFLESHRSFSFGKRQQIVPSSIHTV